MPSNVNKPSIAQAGRGSRRGREAVRPSSETVPRQARAATGASGVDEIKELCISSGAHTHTERKRIEQAPQGHHGEAEK